MDKNFIIGIPVRDFENPMTRLSNTLNKEQRIELSKYMFLIPELAIQKGSHTRTSRARHGGAEGPGLTENQRV